MRRRYRFSLLGLLLTVTAAGAVIAHLANIHQQKVRALHELRRRGAIVGDSKQRAEADRVSMMLISRKPTPLEPFETDWLGDPQIVSIDLTNIEDDDALLRELTHFDAVEHLACDGIEVTSQAWSRIGRLRNLKSLNLARSSVGDADFAQWDLPELTWLDLSQTKVSDEGLATIGRSQRLEVIYLQGTHITDITLRRLAGIPGLKTVGLDSPGITRLGADQLQAALPNCKIVGRLPLPLTRRTASEADLGTGDSHDFELLDRRDAPED